MDVRRLCATLLFTALLSPLSSSAANAPLPPVPNLESSIETYKNQHKGNGGPNAADRQLMQQAGQDLASAMPDPGLKVGDRAPDFELTNAFGKPIRLSQELKKGPVIIAFYRGAWCPFCNLQLKAMHESMPHFKRYGATLLTITPQTPDHSLGQVKKDGLPFEILSDLSDLVTQAYGLYFEVPENLHNLYIRNFDLDITRFNGPGRRGLPIPGTFVIDRNGIVRAAFADTDYKKRMEPQAIIDALAALPR